jgi:prophage regulatory protein
MTILVAHAGDLIEVVPHRSERRDRSPQRIQFLLEQGGDSPHVRPSQVRRIGCKVTGLCRSMIYQLEAERRFPCRIKLGLRAVGWIEGEVQEWLAVRIERSRGSASD